MHKWCWEKLSSNKKTETQKNVNGKKWAEQQKKTDIHIEMKKQN